MLALPLSREGGHLDWQLYQGTWRGRRGGSEPGMHSCGHHRPQFRRAVPSHWPVSAGVVTLKYTQTYLKNKGVEAKGLLKVTLHSPAEV